MYEFKLNHKNMFKKLLVISIFLASICISSRALLHPEFFRVHDFVHGARISELHLAMSEGHFPVRWTKNFGFGYGMPLFEFYAPLPYYVGGFIYWITQNLIFSVKMLWLIPNIVSFVGAYKLGKRLFGTVGGLVTAVAFTLAPYRAVDLYVRGAVGEVWAMATFPWIIEYLLATVNREKHAWKKFTVSLVTLLLSHNLMTLLFMPIVGLLTLVCGGIVLPRVKKNERALFGLRVVGPLFLSIGMSAFYLIPALVEKGFTQVEERILSGYFHYSLHFLYIRQFFKENWKYGGSQWGPGDDMSFFLGYGQIGLLIILGLVILAGSVLLFKKRNNASKNETKQVFNLKKHISTITPNKVVCLSILPLLMISLLMSLQKSEWIWNTLSPLQVVQFPWRFLSLIIFFLALANGYLFRLLTDKKLRILLFVLSVLLFSVPAWKYFQPETFLDNAEALYYSDEERIKKEMSEILPDYIPSRLSKTIHPRQEHRYQYVYDPGKVEVLVDHTHELLIKTEAVAETTLQLNIADYPGWTIEIDRQKIQPEINSLGLPEFVVPEGNHTVSARLLATPVRMISDLVSVFSLLIFVFFILEPKEIKELTNTSKKDSD